MKTLIRTPTIDFWMTRLKAAGKRFDQNVESSERFAALKDMKEALKRLDMEAERQQKAQTKQ